jgi:hypothetical protein
LSWPSAARSPSACWTAIPPPPLGAHDVLSIQIASIRLECGRRRRRRRRRSRQPRPPHPDLLPARRVLRQVAANEAKLRRPVLTRPTGRRRNHDGRSRGWRPVSRW